MKKKINERVAQKWIIEMSLLDLRNARNIGKKSSLKKHERRHIRLSPFQRGKRGMHLSQNKRGGER